MIEHTKKLFDHFMNGNVKWPILRKIILIILNKIRNNFVCHYLIRASFGSSIFWFVLGIAERVDVVGL